MERDKLLGTMDAKVWTDEFMATKARLGDEEFDHAMMLAWFANAIMAGFDEANRRAQRALDAEREKVKELVANQAEYEKCTDEQITALNQGCLDYEKQIATLQAQLRQVEGERDDYRLMYMSLTGETYDNPLSRAHNELSTLRQLVEALPVVDGRMDVECGACYYIRSFVAGQYGIVCGLITEQSTAMAIKALLEYRAALAAQDAGVVIRRIVDDSFGSQMEMCSREDCGLQVVRPGQFQCLHPNCYDADQPHPTEERHEQR